MAASADNFLVLERPSADIYRALLHASDINARDDDGRAALHLAALGRNPVAVSVLLEAGVDVDIAQEDEHQLTPLALAVFYPKNTEVIKLLLAGGADVCVKYPVGRSVLESVKESHEEKDFYYAGYYDIFRQHLDAGHHCPCCVAEKVGGE